MGLNRRVVPGLLAVALVGGAWAGDEKPAEPAAPPPESIYMKAARPRTEDVKVFTDADLQRISAGGGAWATHPVEEPAEPGAEGEESARVVPPGPDPLKVLDDQIRQQRERAGRMAQAQIDLATAQQNLKAMEYQAFSARNPFVTPAKLTDEERDYRLTHEETALERYQRTEAMVEEARAKVAAAEGALERARGGR